jgi:hypothetical protein
MLVITIFAAALALWAIGWALCAFERYTFKRFQHRFFTINAFLCALLAMALMYFGWWWWHTARASGGDELNGILLTGLGATVAVGMVIRNMRRAGPVLGACGSLLQVALFTTFGGFGIVALIVGAVCFAGVLAGSAAKPVYVINRWS